MIAEIWKCGHVGMCGCGFVGMLELGNVGMCDCGFVETSKCVNGDICGCCSLV